MNRNPICVKSAIRFARFISRSHAGTTFAFSVFFRLFTKRDKRLGRSSIVIAAGSKLWSMDRFLSILKKLSSREGIWTRMTKVKRVMRGAIKSGVSSSLRWLLRRLRIFIRKFNTSKNNKILRKSRICWVDSVRFKWISN